MGNPRRYHFKLPPYRGPVLDEPPHSWFPGVRAHHKTATSDRHLHSDGKIRTFVIHATAGYSSSGAMSVLFNHRASWHWLVPDENEAEHGVKVWACMPESRAAWHVRNQRSHPDINADRTHVNYWSLGVEIVNRQKDDPFSDWQIEQTAALVRYAWSKYPDLVDVVSHAKLDPSRRSNPGKHFPWDEFRARVLAPSVSAHQPIEIVSPTGKTVDCNPRPSDGVTVAEVWPLVEALGFRVEYEDGPPRRVLIRKGGQTESRRIRKSKVRKKTRARGTKKPTR